MSINPSRQDPEHTDDVSDIASYYDNNTEREHSRLERHQLEYDLTWRYLNRYLPAQGSILEVGAATGRYTLELAKRGYAVTAVDLSAALLEENSERSADAGLPRQVRYVVADARDLGAVAEWGFDAVLLMGPLYHLIVEADRKAALKAAFDWLKAGGILFSIFLSRYGVIGEMLKKSAGWIEDQAVVRSLLENGRRPDGYPAGGFRGYFARVSEIAPLHEAVGFETITLAGIEPAISADDESYNQLRGTQRQLWLDLFEEIGTERSTVGASRHLLYVGRRK
jgi:SAM-dependent methyltransferase